MPTQPPVSSNDIAHLVTEVLRRIHAETDGSKTQSAGLTPPETTATVPDRVIAAETIIKLAPGTRVAYVKHKAVITPSARGSCSRSWDHVGSCKSEHVPTNGVTAVYCSGRMFDRRVECCSNNSSCGINNPTTSFRRPCKQLLSLSLTMLAVMQPDAFYSLKMPPWPVWQPIAFTQSELLLVQIPRQWPTPSHGALQT